MAEFICGSESEFVKKMNTRAKELGMENTNFVNCNGLDTEGHVTTARDIALMSRELISRYPEIQNYSMIWMENITHTTKKGISEFGLTNTNKLVRQYEYTTGLKTGSTNEAKFCVSATARKNDMDLIAVIMAAEDSKTRFRDAMNLLNYGFGKCMKYSDDGIGRISDVPVVQGKEDSVEVKQEKAFQYIDTTGTDLSAIEKNPVLYKSLKAPVNKGEKAGEMEYYMNGSKIGFVDIVTRKSVEKMNYIHALERALDYFFL